MTNWKKSLGRKVSTPKQLLVEGRTAEMFFREWVEATELKTTTEVRDFGSLSQLGGYLRLFAGRPEFREKVVAIGIIRDAEGSAATAAFQSVCHNLNAAGLIPPDDILSFGAGAPKTGVFILPDCENPGMLETLCWSALECEEDLESHVSCVGVYLESVAKKREIVNHSKAKIWTYLSGFGDFDPLLGRAAQAKVWKWSSPAFKQLGTFLNGL